MDERNQYDNKLPMIYYSTDEDEEQDQHHQLQSQMNDGQESYQE
jgi:hypothetical protein